MVFKIPDIEVMNINKLLLYYIVMVKLLHIDLSMTDKVLPLFICT